MQVHFQTSCLNLHLPLMQRHLQYAFYRYRLTFFTKLSIDYNLTSSIVVTRLLNCIQYITLPLLY